MVALFELNSYESQTHVHFTRLFCIAVAVCSTSSKPLQHVLIQIVQGLLLSESVPQRNQQLARLMPGGDEVAQPASFNAQLGTQKNHTVGKRVAQGLWMNHSC